MTKINNTFFPDSYEIENKKTYNSKKRLSLVIFMFRCHRFESQMGEKPKFNLKSVFDQTENKTAHFKAKVQFLPYKVVFFEK